MLVRTALAADKPEILELRRLGAERAFAASAETPAILSALVAERVDAAKLDGELSDDDCIVMVATIDGRVVGTAQLIVADDAGEMSACSSAVQRRGIGSALMRARLELAEELGLHKVWLETDTVNPDGMAHAVRHGFSPVASRTGARIPGNRVVLYERELP